MNTPPSSFVLVCGLMLIMHAGPLAAQELPELTRYLEGLQKNRRFSGHVLLTCVEWMPGYDRILGTTPLHDRGVGFRDAQQTLPFSDSTRFLIGSVTKPFIASVVQKLAASGNLQLEATIDAWFPEFPRADMITVQHLLDHRGGIADYKSLRDWQQYEASEPNPRETIRRMARELPLLFEPGEQFRYSNVGYIMLGVIIEEVTGRPLEEVVQELLTTDLSLRSTHVAVHGVNWRRSGTAAEGFRSTPEGRTLAPPPVLGLPFTSGNMVSTPFDLHSFVTSQILSQHLPDSAHAEDWIAARAPYKNGWAMREFDGVPGIGHFGAMSGYVCSVTWLPTKGLLLVICGNDDHIPYRTMTADIVKGLITGTFPSVVDETPEGLPSAERLRCIGRYQIPGGSILEISDDKGLVMRETGQEPLRLYPIVGQRFSFVQLERFVRFEGLNKDAFQTLILEDLHGVPLVEARRVE